MNGRGEYPAAFLWTVERQNTGDGRSPILAMAYELKS